VRQLAAAFTVEARFEKQGAGNPAQHNMPNRITVRYEGRVQGVGFRFTVVNLAQDLDVTGWVKNEFDGSVSMVAEGEEDQLMALLQAVQGSHLGRLINNEQIGRSTATGEFKTFGVVY